MIVVADDTDVAVILCYHWNKKEHKEVCSFTKREKPNAGAYQKPCQNWVIWKIIYFSFVRVRMWYNVFYHEQRETKLLQSNTEISIDKDYLWSNDWLLGREWRCIWCRYQHVPLSIWWYSRFFFNQNEVRKTFTHFYIGIFTFSNATMFLHCSIHYISDSTTILLLSSSRALKNLFKIIKIA